MSPLVVGMALTDCEGVVHPLVGVGHGVGGVSPQVVQVEPASKNVGGLDRYYALQSNPPI